MVALAKVSTAVWLALQSWRARSTTPRLALTKMSGIAGFFRRSDSLARRDVIQEMLRSMSSDSLTPLGVASCSTFGLELGWFSTPEVANDCTSAWNERKDAFLLFRGEVFPSDGAVGMSENGEGPTNIAADLLHQYEELNSALFSRLNGCFSGVLVDIRRSCVVLFNDRYGLGRIYYYDAPDGFYFSSEAKALLKVVPSLKQLDVRSVGEFLACDCVLQNRTIFRGVSVLPAGSAWTFGPDFIFEKRRYFDPRTWEDQPRLSPEDYHQSLKELFPNILKRYLQHPAGVGMSLTGGLDGR